MDQEEYILYFRQCFANGMVFWWYDGVGPLSAALAPADTPLSAKGWYYRSPKPLHSSAALWQPRCILRGGVILPVFVRFFALHSGYKSCPSGNFSKHGLPTTSSSSCARTRLLCVDLETPFCLPRRVFLGACFLILHMYAPALIVAVVLFSPLRPDRMIDVFDLLLIVDNNEPNDLYTLVQHQAVRARDTLRR